MSFGYSNKRIAFFYKINNHTRFGGIKLTNKGQLKSQTVTQLLNGTITTIKSIVPIENNIIKPRVIDNDFELQYGVLIGITGDVKATLIFTGSTNTFSLIGEKMYGMPLEGEMLLSFSGELGNMIAGGLSTNISHKGATVNITTPTVMNENTIVTGYKRIVELPIEFKNAGKMNTYLLLS